MECDQKSIAWRRGLDFARQRSSALRGSLGMTPSAESARHHERFDHAQCRRSLASRLYRAVNLRPCSASISRPRRDKAYFSPLVGLGGGIVSSQWQIRLQASSKHMRAFSAQGLAQPEAFMKWSEEGWPASRFLKWDSLFADVA
jgi:hypothetical protein